jgi:hypothetical protein
MRIAVRKLRRRLAHLCRGVKMGLSYADAVVLAGGRNSRTVAALDHLTGGVLLAAAATGAGFALSLFDAKSELARLSDEVVRKVGQRLRKVDRFTRSQRLAAAHSVLVLSAYFDALAGGGLPFPAKDLEFTKAEQVSMATGTAPGSSRLSGLAVGLLRPEVPMPAPQRPYEETLAAMRCFYVALSAEVAQFISGLTVWDRLDEQHRARLAAALSGDLPDQALARYEERFRQLAAEFPEVAFWANLVDHQATRADVRRLSTGMAGMERILADISAGRLPDDRRLALSRAYQAVLRQPVLTSADAPHGLRLPLLGEAYVNPDFRVVEATRLTERFANESWWKEQRVRDDLEGFLIGHLTSPQAAEAPLLILGQPGSGKSVLTQMLAARLPPDKFLVVRVVLREVPADTDLQSQIEAAVRSATGESLNWPDLARSAAGALPVVLLDGFEELLQATGVSRSDYLDKVAEFQAREAALGRPVAVVVTSRTAVADRAKPPHGMVVARLEPFRETQISHWLGTWNRINAAEFAAHGLRPLTTQAVLEHGDLASQPLLLIMLALYDADANALQHPGIAVGEAKLYERLLVSFVEREFRKSGTDLTGKQFREAVERELLQLSAVAIAMFSRGRQWIRDEELNVDLTALLRSPGGQDGRSDFQAPHTAAQVVVSRFFFVHEAQATRDDARLHTYEFLHDTFGEYLIARLITRELQDLVTAARLAAGRSRPEPADDAFLYALLSYMPLTLRGTIVSFMADTIRSLPRLQRQRLRALVLGLFRDAPAARRDNRYSEYAPLTLSVPTRYAIYLVNLAVLAILAAGDLTGTSLFPGARDPVEGWGKLARLWHSQLPSEGWAGLVDMIALDRIWRRDGRRDIVLRYEARSRARSKRIDLFWSHNLNPDFTYRRSGRPFGWLRNYDAWLREQTWFLCDADGDTFAHALGSFADSEPAICSFHSYWPGENRTVSAAGALITLWMASGSECPADELASAYDTCLEIAIRARFGPNRSKLRERFRMLVLHQLATDWRRLPPAWLGLTITRIRNAASKPSDEVTEPAELLLIASQAIPELMAADFAIPLAGDEGARRAGVARGGARKRIG